MKKIISVALSFMLVLGLSGCLIEFEPYYDTEGQTMTFVESKMVTVNDMEFIGIFFDYTNESGETKAPCDSFNVKAFQNGVEISVAVFTGQVIEDAIQVDTQVQTGHTTRVVALFKTVDDSPVTVEVSNGETFTVEVK